MKIPYLVIAAWPLLTPLSVSAEQSPTSLPPLVVTAARVAQSADQSLASVTVIDRQEIERRQALSVPDLLRSVAGVSLANSGGRGQPSSVFIRGAESDHVLVLIDGVKVGSASLGGTPFEHLPVDLIERIEIVRGPRSSLYGSEAIGGVIQIFTRKGGGELTPSLHLEAGSYDTYKASATLSGGGDKASFNASVSGVDTQGFNACNGEPWVAGCFTHEPDKDGYRNLSGSLRAGYRFDNGAAVDAHWLRSDADSQYDGSYQNESETMQQVLGLGVSFSAGEIWSIALKGGRSWDESDNFKDDAFSASFDTRRDTLSWQNDLSLAEDQLLTLGLDYQNDEVDGSTAYAVSSRDNTGLFGQYLGQYGQHEWQLSLRGDDNEQFGRETTGSLAWAYAFAGGPRLSASYGTAFKAPTFNELYYPYFGNPDLSPEQSKSLELGLAAHHGWGHWSLHVYQTDIDDLIAFDANSYAPANIDSTRIRGLEVIVGTQLGQWDLDANLTLLDPVNKSDGPNRDNLLPRRAEQSINIDVQRTFGAFSLGAALNGVGKRYDDFANTRKLDAYLTVDLRGEYRIDQAWRVQARLDNLFDEDYETAAYYNQPGRSLFVSLRYQP